MMVGSTCTYPSIHLSLRWRVENSWKLHSPYERGGWKMWARPPVMSPATQHPSSLSKTKFACGQLFRLEQSHHRIDRGDDPREMNRCAMHTCDNNATKVWWREHVLRDFQAAPLLALLFWRSSNATNRLSTSTPWSPCLSSVNSMVTVGLASFCAAISAALWSCDGVWNEQKRSNTTTRKSHIPYSWAAQLETCLQPIAGASGEVSCLQRSTSTTLAQRRAAPTRVWRRSGRAPTNTSAVRADADHRSFSAHIEHPKEQVSSQKPTAQWVSVAQVNTTK